MKRIITLMLLLIAVSSFSQDYINGEIEYEVDSCFIERCTTELVNVRFYDEPTQDIIEGQAVAYSVCYTKNAFRVYCNKRMGFRYRTNKYYIQIFRYGVFHRSYLKVFGSKVIDYSEL